MITTLSLSPFNYFFLNFLTFPLFFIFLIKKINLHNNFKFFFIYGWVFGFGYFLTNLYWISISLTFDQNFKFLMPFTIIFIPAFLAIFYGLVTIIFRILNPKKKILSSFFIFSLIFGVLEFIRGSILTGFPWNLIVYSFSNQLELVSIISIIGTYGFNLFCISLFTSPALFILKDRNKDIGVCVFFLISIAALYFYGSNYKEKFNNTAKKSNNYKIRVIGSNISLDRFYSNTDTASVIEELIKLSNPNLNEKTIFVWPEGMLPGITNEELMKYNELFEKKFSQNHILFIGTNSQLTKNGSTKYFNSLSIYDHELNLLDTYHKINLVPFGEFLPAENLLKKIGLRSLTNNYQSFSQGKQRKIIEIKRENFSLKILPLICYEIIYSGNISRNSEFDLIINVSEDGWFGRSIGPKQHFDHSIFRAIESGKYLIRSANNGISAIINPIGIVEQKIKFKQSGFLDYKESNKIQPTIFSQYGNKIFGLLILLYIFLIFSFNRIKNE